MNPKLSINTHPSSPGIASHNQVLIDATLALYAHAEPQPGIEARVVARIASAERNFERNRSAARLLLWKRLSTGALATAGACGIVVGTVQHSRHNLPPQAFRSQAVRSTTGSSGGVSTSDAAHTPTRMVPVSPRIDPNAPRTPAHGRAQISHTPNHHPNGVASPKSPYPPTPQEDQQQ